jgi:hypothetical protein
MGLVVSTAGSFLSDLGRGSGPLSHRQHRRTKRPIAEHQDITAINY